MDGYLLVNLMHVHDGRIGRREMIDVPKKGDWIKLSNQTYIVINVIWNFDDARTVDVYVDELED